MITFIITYIIISILSIGVRLGNKFEPTTFNTSTQIWTTIIQICFIIWALTLIL